jgi:hypothetical protein
MNESATECDETDEEILNPEVSDRELELAAGILKSSETFNSVAQCTVTICCQCDETIAVQPTEGAVHLLMQRG